MNAEDRRKLALVSLQKTTDTAYSIAQKLHLSYQDVIDVATTNGIDLTKRR